VEVYIRNLRKKLRDTGKGEKALIKTRRGFGYQLSSKNV
jgi:DNA-binding response OmpR family regulator